jgi:hypothetical protein
MKKFLVDKIVLLIVAVAFCIIAIILSGDLSLYFILITIPLFWIATIIKKKYPDFPESHQSAVNCDKEKLLELITVGTDINTKDNYGQTAIVQLFMNADQNVTDQIQYIKILLEHGFNINEVMTQKNASVSILDFAIGFKTSSEIIDLLRKHGGKTGEELKAEGK